MPTRRWGPAIPSANHRLRVLSADGNERDAGAVDEAIERIAFAVSVRSGHRNARRGRSLGGQGLALDGGPDVLCAVVTTDDGEAVLLELDDTGRETKRMGPFPDAGRELSAMAEGTFVVGRAEAFRLLPDPLSQ